MNDESDGLAARCAADFHSFLHFRDVCMVIGIGNQQDGTLAQGAFTCLSLFYGRLGGVLFPTSEKRENSFEICGLLEF